MCCYGSTCIKIGTIQRRLAWPLRKDDTQICEAFQVFLWRRGVVVITTAELHSTNPEFRFCAGSNPARGM